MKICNKCGFDLPLDNFHNRAASKDGKSPTCIECDKTRHAVYYKANRKLLLKQKKTYAIINKVEIAKTKRLYQLNNPTKVRQMHRDRKRNRSKVDELFRLKNNMRNLIGRLFINKGLKKTSKSHEILGCSYEEFKEYIENQFQSWMNWDNYGRYNGQPSYGWDIDHIVPLSTAKTEEEIIKLNHYTNLQPLCSKINRYIKKNK